MTCKEAEKQIPSFLQDELDEESLAEFVEHVKECDDCEEELAIRYLTVEGLARLEEGASFSLDDELAYKIQHADRRVKINTKIEKICRSIESVAILVLGIAIVYMVW
jgi:hypothetical protein